MARLNILDMLYTKDMNPLDFSFESLTANPLLSYLSPDDIYQLYKIASSAKLSTNPQEKYRRIKAIVEPRGFRKIASGTNRIAYKHLEDTRIIIKIAIDEIGLKDSHREYKNQFLLKPFVTKVFEVSPCGTVGLFERVYPVQTIYEYQSIASDVFDVINTKIIGKYVLDDIGTEFFQNVGVRKGFGVVYLDFPYVYELDGKKLYCNANINGLPCGGEIDYDAGFNRLICTKCGARYFAKQLAKQELNKEIILKRKGRKQKMKFSIMQGSNVLEEIVTQNESNVLPVKKEKTERRMRENKDTNSNFAYDIPKRRSFSITTENEFEHDIESIDAPEIKVSSSSRKTYSIIDESANCNVEDKSKPKQLQQKSNENIKSSDFGGGIGTAYQNPNIADKKEESQQSIAINTEENAEIVEEDNDITMVKSLTITPRDGVEYSEEADYSDDYNAVYQNEDYSEETDTQYESKTVLASY